MEGKEITAKEIELGIPWRIASMNEKNCFYVIHGKDYASTDGREMQILSMQYGYHPIKEHRARIRANAEIIVEAVNNYTTLQLQLEKAKELISFMTKVANGKMSTKSKSVELRFEKDTLLTWVKNSTTFLNEGKK